MRVVVAVAVVAAALVASASAAPPATKSPGILTVGLAMPSAGFQVGAVRGRDVVLAKGFEIDLARALAKRLELTTRVRFVNEQLFSRLTAAGPKDYDLALAEISITPARAKRVDFSVPYLRADQGVLVRRGLESVPRSIADLRKLQLCAERATTGSLLVASTIKPLKKPLVARNPSDLSYYLFTKRCDAIVFDAPTLAVLRRQAPDRYGPLAGRVVTNEKYAAAFEKGSALRARVNTVLGALARDGSLDRLRKRWLGADTSALPVLR
jgi:polar amino acid transport system substrate-binding protein